MSESSAHRHTLGNKLPLLYHTGSLVDFSKLWGISEPKFYKFGRNVFKFEIRARDEVVTLLSIPSLVFAVFLKRSHLFN